MPEKPTWSEVKERCAATKEELDNYLEYIEQSIRYLTNLRNSLLDGSAIALAERHSLMLYVDGLANEKSYATKDDDGSINMTGRCMISLLVSGNQSDVVENFNNAIIQSYELPQHSNELKRLRLVEVQGEAKSQSDVSYSA